MLIRPGARNNDVIAMFANYLHFVKMVENTPVGLVNRSHEWVRGFHGAIGISGEAGEIEQLFKKDMFGKNKPINRTDIVNECGDMLWYFVLVLDAFTITFEELIEWNTAKLAQRYAEKINKEDNRGEYIHLREVEKREVQQQKSDEITKVVEIVSTFLPSEEQEKLYNAINKLVASQKEDQNVRELVHGAADHNSDNSDSVQSS